MLRLRLIGGLAVEVDGEQRGVPQSRRGKSLLAWLALNPGVHSRSKVAATFWPDVLDRSARASLRVALTDVRKALGPATGGCLVATRDAVGLTIGDGLSIDLVELERLVDQERLTEAVELGQGELLPELDDEWALEARDRHRERMAELLERLAAEAEAEGDPRAAVRWSRRRAELDPLSEEAAVQLIRLLAVAGDHAAAMAAYERLRKRLATTLGIVPSPSTRELVAGLRDQAEPAPPAAAADPPAPEPSPGALVTLLFTDLVASTELAQALGDTAAEAVMGDHLESLRQVVRERGGRELKQLGDGLMVAFSSAAEAVGCAAGMQRAVARSNRLRPECPPLSMRVGVHAGEVGANGVDVSGTPVVVAKRLCDAAAGGQVLVSNLVRELVGSRAGERFRELGERELKGLSGPVAVSELSCEAPAEPAVLPALVAASERRPFVGRENALESLERVLREVRAGARRLATIAGEPGIGKTRLAARFASLAHAEGMPVLFGRCFEETLAPYQAFVEALEPYLRFLPERELEAALGAKAQELARLFPELRTRATPSPPDVVAEAEGSRLRLFDAVAALLGTAARPNGLLLVVDDLHWADQPTLLLLGHLLRSPDDLPLMLVATYRDSELRPGHPLDALLSDLAREQPPVRLPLSGLSEPQVRGLVALAEAPEEIAPAMHAHTGGNPLFVLELLRERKGAGVVEPGEGPPGTDTNGLAVPDSVKALIRRRLGRLGEPSDRLLRLAAVAGVEFEFDLLERISELSGEPLADALDQAVAARLIEEDQDAYGRFHFAHPLIREALYEDTSRTRRVLLHRRVGEAVEELYTDALEVHAAELAHHYFEAARGGSPEKGIDWAIRAGRVATAKLAYEEAATEYERALALVADDERRRCELLLALGESRFSAGHFAAARATFREAGELARRLELAAELAHAALGFGGRLGFEVGVVNSELIELLEEALAQLPAAASPLRAQVMGRLAEALAFSPERARGEVLAREAIGMARRMGDKAVLADVLARGVLATWGPDNVEERLAMAEEIVAVAAEAGAIRYEVEGRAYVASVLGELGNVEAVDREIEAGRRLVQEMREPYYLWALEVGSAWRPMFAGALEEGEAHVWRALEVVPVAENPAALELFVAQIYYLLGLQGRLAEARAAAEALAEHFVAMPVLRCALALIYAELGALADARREFERLAANDFDDLPRDIEWLHAMSQLADVCAILGDERRAVTLYEMLEPYAQRNIVIGLIGTTDGYVARPLGLMAAVTGNFDEAERHLDAALELNAGIGALPALAQARLDYARVLLQRAGPGDRERALALLDEALEPAERLRWDGLRAKCLALRAETEGQAPEKAPRGPRRPFATLASEAGAGARAAVSTRAQATLARLIHDVSDTTLERRFGSPLALRAILTATARSFQPGLAYGFEGEILLELTHIPLAGSARPREQWTLAVKGKRASARRGNGDQPALMLRGSVPDLIRFICGVLNPVTALLDGRAEAKGDLIVGSRLPEMFGGAPVFTALSKGVKAGSPTGGERTIGSGARRPPSGVER